MTNRFLLLSVIVLIICQIGCSHIEKPLTIHESELIKIKQLTENVFIHVSYLDITGYAPSPCNGIIFKNENESIVFDTPPATGASKELIRWINDSLNCTISGINVNHNHVDCLGGLEVFHEAKIHSYSHNLTKELAEITETEIPQNTFTKSLKFKIGNKMIINNFIGEGHTKDNIISFIPSENVLFGGCMIKEVGASKGNVKDANLEAWPLTVQAIKEKYSDIQYIVPGHGKTGGVELLDYTIDLFKIN